MPSFRRSSPRRKPTSLDPRARYRAPMTVLVTGASGHIGNNLVRALMARGERPRVLVHDEIRALAGLDVERVQGDVLDPASLDVACAGIDVVYHLAALISLDARDDERVLLLNEHGPKNVAAACLRAKVRRLVHFSSIHALSSEPRGEMVTEERGLTQSSYCTAYDRSKALGEAQIAAAVKRGLDAVIVNPTGVVGPGDFMPSAMGEMLLQLSRGELPGLVAGSFDWVDVRDVVSSAIAAAERGQSGERYILGGAHATIPEVARLAGEIGGFPIPKMISPIWLAKLAAPFATGWARLRNRRPLFTKASLNAVSEHRSVSHEKATRVLGHHPRPLRESLTDALQEFRERGLLGAPNLMGREPP
ncbi:MAG: NAD-dependent epimerase/dehydratase family protein [Myxococcales bacterium]|nr:NAD-dependent epimerase/dehydratase family protein [Myxococcales bacterium]